MAQKRETIRFSVDFVEKQHAFLKSFATQNGTKNTVLLRALLYRVEIDEDFANRMIDLVNEALEKEEEQKSVEEK